MRERLEQDDGLVLRLSTYQRMRASRRESGGKAAGWWGRIQARSRMILAAVGASFARPYDEEWK
ncbi:hypothetical protein K2X89_15970 [Myxococcota bacterium]|nr:hypothetical protein [Myxococcota bacterium]